MMKRNRIWHVGPKGDRYRTAIRLWGRWRIHVFWRGDYDRVCHDHPNDFWTFPLMSYVEEVWDEAIKFHRWNVVKSFRWHFRPAEYRHRLLGRNHPLLKGVFITLVKEGPEHRPWGFWLRDDEGVYKWIYWRTYLGQKSRDSSAANNQENS